MEPEEKKKAPTPTPPPPAIQPSFNAQECNLPKIEPDLKMGFNNPFRYNHQRYMAAAAAAAAAAATAASTPTNGKNTVLCD